MTMTLEMITVNTADALTLARWWAEQTGGTILQENDGWYVITELPGGLRLSFQKVDDPAPGNRIHLDLIAPDLDAEVERLIGAGAGKVADRSLPGGFRWTVLTDPDGNEFCVGSGVEPV